MPAQLGRGAEQELLVELVAPAAEVAVHQAGILRLGPLGVANRASQHRIGETRGEAFQLGLHQPGDIRVRACVARRNMGVAVQGVLAGRGARGIKQGVLSDDQGGSLWHVPPLAGLRRSGEIAQFAADMDHGARAGAGAPPRAAVPPGAER